MKLELHIGGEVVGELTFTNIYVDNFATEEAFERREELINERVRQLKKEFLRGHKTNLPYEIYLIQQSRAHYGPMTRTYRRNNKKDYRPEGVSTYSHKIGMKSHDK